MCVYARVSEIENVCERGEGERERDDGGGWVAERLAESGDAGGGSESLIG